MGLLDDIRDQQAHSHATKCSVFLAQQAMDKGDSADLAAAMADPGITAAAISRALKARTVNVGQQAIARHRRGLCGCPR
jgi:hypothetical protein